MRTLPLVLLLAVGGCACLGGPTKPVFIEPHSSGGTPPSSPPSTPPGQPPGTPPGEPPSDPPASGKNNRGHGNANENTDPQLNGLAGINRDADNPGKKK